jgi:hypothetical protein
MTEHELVANKVAQNGEPMPMERQGDPYAVKSLASPVGDVRHLLSSTRGPGSLAGPRPAALAGSILRLQRACGNRSVQRALGLDRKPDGSGEIEPEVEAEIERSRGGGLALDTGTQRQMESAFGVNFGGVRIHTGAESHSLNRAVSAVAFTTGSDIFFRDGAYDPGSSGGRELLAHELTHVVQQGGSAPLLGTAQRFPIQRMCHECQEEKKKTVRPKLVVGEPGDAFEQEAERIASVVAAGHLRGAWDGNQPASGSTTAVEQAAGTPAHVQRVSWDDVTGAVSNFGQAAKEDAQAAASAVSSGAQAVGSAVTSGAMAVSTAVSNGAQAVGGAVVSGAQAVGSAVISGGQAIGAAANAGAQAVGGAVAGVVENAALKAANAVAGLLGGKVTVSPSGAIVITIPDKQIAEVEDETFVLPLGITAQPLFEGDVKIGDFVVKGYVGTIYGDPTATVAIGPVKLQNIALVLDPSAGSYIGTAQLYVGSALVGSVEKATEGRVQAAGVIPMDPPIPIEASAALGIRTILRLAGKEGFTDKVTVGYSGGSFILQHALDVKLGGVAESAREVFLRIEVEGEEVCSVIWPMGRPTRLAKGIEIGLPITVDTGGKKAVTIGTPKTNPISPDDIPTVLEDDHEPEKCKSLKEFAEFLCKKGKLPSSVCSVLGPGTVGPPGTPAVTPLVGPSVGPLPVAPSLPGGGGGGTTPVVPLAACPNPPPLPVILLLPSLKGNDLDRYADWQTKGPLQHQVGRPRDTGQLYRWLALMPGRIPSQVKQRAISLGLDIDDVVRPYWSKDRVLGARMQVDHIVEIQVAPIGREGELDNMANYRLMEAEQNASVGPELSGNIKKMRDALQAKDGAPWDQCDLTFDRVSSSGAKTPSTWTKEELQSGAQLDAYERLGKPPKP